MVAMEHKNAAHFPSMPNFRQVNKFEEEKKEGKLKYKLYRSSRPDFLTVTEVNSFRKLGIKTIIDFRSHREYKKANGSKMLDSAFPVYKVHLPFMLKYKPDQDVQYKKIKVKPPQSKSTDDSGSETEVGVADVDGEVGVADNKVGVAPPRGEGMEGEQGKHFLVDFFKMNYVYAVFTRAPWYVRLYSVLYLIYDVIFNTGFRYFVSLFARKVLNHTGLTGQYIDMLTYSQASICSGRSMQAMQPDLVITTLSTLWASLKLIDVD